MRTGLKQKYSMKSCQLPNIKHKDYVTFYSICEVASLIFFFFFGKLLYIQEIKLPQYCQSLCLTLDVRMKTLGLCPQVIRSCREGAYKQTVQCLVIRASINVLNILQQQHRGGIQGYQAYNSF